MFSKVDNDIKTFSYILRYLKNCHNEDEAFILDGNLQREEIEQHSQLNNNFSMEEKLNWVNQHSKGFREYINTMKIFWAAWILMGKKEEEFTYEVFINMKKRFNNIQSVLESIYN